MRTFIEILKSGRALTFSEILKKNPYHDEKGRFTTAANAVNGGISARGANDFTVKGFVNKQKLNNHWKNGRTHQEEYIKDGIVTAKQYEQRAVELVQSPCGNGIDGYKTADGNICRYDIAKNDYVKGNPKKGIHTMFKPDRGYEYFKEFKEREGILDD